MTVPDVFAERDKAQEQYDQALAVLVAGTPPNRLVRAAREGAEQAFRLACLRTAEQEPDDALRWLRTASELFALLFLRLLHRDERATIEYDVAGRHIVAGVIQVKRAASPRLLTQAILCAWAAGDFAAAAEIGSVPTQLFRSTEDTDDEVGMFWTFALASIARGNVPAYQRAAANLRAIDANPRAKELGELRGLILPALDALDAALERKFKVVQRKLVQVRRFHFWLHRAEDDVDRYLDLTSLAIDTWSKQPGGVLEKPATVE